MCSVLSFSIRSLAILQDIMCQQKQRPTGPCAPMGLLGQKGPKRQRPTHQGPGGCGSRWRGMAQRRTTLFTSREGNGRPFEAPSRYNRTYAPVIRQSEIFISFYFVLVNGFENRKKLSIYKI